LPVVAMTLTPILLSNGCCCCETMVAETHGFEVVLRQQLEAPVRVCWVVQQGAK
jgi:hypothetical protein